MYLKDANGRHNCKFSRIPLALNPGTIVFRPQELAAQFKFPYYYHFEDTEFHTSLILNTLRRLWPKRIITDQLYDRLTIDLHSFEQDGYSLPVFAM